MLAPRQHQHEVFVSSRYCLLFEWLSRCCFGDRRHCSKVWRQSFFNSPTADKNWQKKGDNLRQRQSIFTLDKATCFRFAFCDSDVVTRQRDTFVTTPINIKLLSRSRYLVSCCHVMVQKGRLVCWRVTAFSVFLRQMRKLIPVIPRS